MRRKTATPATNDPPSAPELAPDQTERNEPPRGDNVTLDDEDHAILDEIWKTRREETAAAAKLRSSTPGA